jgi:hypothetical protein
MRKLYRKVCEQIDTEIWFIEQLQILTTINYKIFTDVHTEQITTAGTTSSQFGVSLPDVAW